MSIFNINPAGAITGTEKQPLGGGKKKWDVEPKSIGQVVAGAVPTLKPKIGVERRRSDFQSEFFEADHLLQELLMDKVGMIEALELWFKSVWMREYQPKVVNALSLDAGLSRKAMRGNDDWRKLKRATDSEYVEQFAKSRIELEDRIKGMFVKESHAFAMKHIREKIDVSQHLDMIITNAQIERVREYFQRGRSNLVLHIGTRLMETQTSLTREALLNCIIEKKEVSSMVLLEVYRFLSCIYLYTGAMYSSFIVESNIHIEEEEFEGTGMYGLCATAKEGCVCETCVAGKSNQMTGRVRMTRWYQLAGEVVMESGIWGQHQPLMRAIHEMPEEEKYQLFMLLNSGNGAVNQLRQQVEYLKETIDDLEKGKKREVREEKEEKERLAKQLRELNKAKGKNKETPSNEKLPAVAGKVDNSAALAGELAQAKKEIEALKADLGKKSAESERVQALLKSVLAGDQDEGKVDGGVLAKPSVAAVKEKRGIIIGGHYRLMTKIRKELTNCTYYSADAKSVDEDAVRNSEYIMLFTGYVNHALTGHAMRLSRLYGIPLGYTDKTNVQLVMGDVCDLFADTAKRDGD